MYSGDNAPPHPHARYSGNEATIVVATGELLDGSLPARALRLVRDWLGELLARGGVFAEIRDDRQAFEQVRVNDDSHTIEWPRGLDLDPEVLYGRHEPA